eukprot:6045284-Amphidinium_carterae.2
MPGWQRTAETVPCFKCRGTLAASTGGCQAASWEQYSNTFRVLSAKFTEGHPMQVLSQNQCRQVSKSLLGFLTQESRPRKEGSGRTRIGDATLLSIVAEALLDESKSREETYEVQSHSTHQEAHQDALASGPTLGCKNLR